MVKPVKNQVKKENQVDVQIELGNVEVLKVKLLNDISNKLSEVINLLKG